MDEESNVRNQETREKRYYRFLFHVEAEATEVVLFCGEERKDSARIEPNRELLERILPVIDALLAKHALTPKDIAHIRVESDLPDGYSSRRIAETVANVWNELHP